LLCIRAGGGSSKMQPNQTKNRVAKLLRRVRREANRLLARRRYRERKSGVLASVWSVRVGPPPPKPKAGIWSGRHGPGGEIAENHKKRRAAYEAGRIAEHNRRVEARAKKREKRRTNPYGL
jgi:hypothetical protein